jgi:methylated-DNA-protein-cysteine methyltransferase-like protein
MATRTISRDKAASSPRGRPSTLDADPRVQRILAAVDSIPSGRVASYGDVARDAGLPRNARLVGRVLARLPAGARHRVVDAAGRIRVAGRSSIEQRRRLVREGVRMSAKNRVDPAFFVAARRRPAR